MPHYSVFSRNEINKIMRLLAEMNDKTLLERRCIRAVLQKTYGFYISDFSKISPYTCETLRKDISKGLIQIIPFLPELDAFYTGNPNVICSRLNISVGQYCRRYNNVKVGITNNPRRRFYEHIDRNPEMHWERMVVKYKTSSVNNANTVEDWFINNRPDLVNKWTGRSGMSGNGPFYVYFLLGDSRD